MANGPIARRMNEDIKNRAENGDLDDKINEFEHEILLGQGMKPQEPKQGEWIKDPLKKEKPANIRETGSKEGE